MAPCGQHGDFFDKIFPVRKQNHGRQNGGQRCRQTIRDRTTNWPAANRQRRTFPAERFSASGQSRPETARRRSGPSGNQTPAMRRGKWPRLCRREIAIARARCVRPRRPAWPARRGDGCAVHAHAPQTASAPLPKSPSTVSPKPDLPSTRPTLRAPVLPLLDFTDVPARAGADEIIAGGKATQEISTQHTAGCLKPVCGLQLFDPRHVDSHFPMFNRSLDRRTAV